MPSPAAMALATPLGAAGEQRAGALGREVGVDHPHHEDDAGEQQQHLGGVVEEELQSAAEVAGAVHRQRRHQGLRGRSEQPVEPEPDCRGEAPERAADDGRDRRRARVLTARRRGVPCGALHAAVEPPQEIETHVDQADQHRHLDQRADHGRERHRRGDAEDRDGHGDRQLEVVARGGEGQRRGARVVGPDLPGHEEADQEHDREVGAERNRDPQHVQRLGDDPLALDREHHHDGEEQRHERDRRDARDELAVVPVARPSAARGSTRLRMPAANGMPR